MDLKTKLALALVSASLLSMATLGYFNHLWAKDLFLADSQRQLEHVAAGRQEAIGGIFAAWQEEVQSLVGRAQLPQRAGSRLDARDPVSIERISRILREATAASDSLRRATLFDAAGKPLVASDGVEAKPLGALPDAEIAFSGVRVGSDDGLEFVFTAGLTQDERRVASIEATFSGQALQRFVGHTAEVGETGETSLLIPLPADPTRSAAGDDRYIVVSSWEQGAPLDRAPRSMASATATASAALRGEERVFAETSDARGRAVVAATRFLREPGWGLVVQLDTAEALQQADQLLVNMRDLGISLAAFAILGGTLFGLYLGRPIHKLVEEVDRIRHGELGLRLDASGDDEVAFLAQSLNEFMDQLDRSSDLFRLGELRVLVVVPAAAERQLLQDLMKNWNMRPIPADGAAAASREIRRAEKEGQPIQLVLLDDSLPDLANTGWAARVRTSSAGPLPTILLASNAEELDAEQLEQCGIAEVLPKPIVASHLMEAILGVVGVSAEGLTTTKDAYLKKAEPRKILLVEDNALMQRVTLGFLENWGHAVTVAPNGNVAVEAAERERFDLILMDVEMPELNGLEAAAAIRAHENAETGRTPIIALTAEAMPEDRERCLRAGMDDYVSKPVDPKALYALIARCPVGALRSPLPKAARHSPVEPARGDPADAAAVVDWDHARSLAGGDEALLDELIGVFPADSSQQLEEMRRGVAKRDAQLITRSAHSLKSAAQVFGASRLADAALSMEMLGRSAELTNVEALLETVEIETRRLNAALLGRRGAGAAQG
jgi:CheY-like chemotaxis protein